MLSRYPDLHDPTAAEPTLRILLGALASDKLDWLLYSTPKLRLRAAAQGKEEKEEEDGRPSLYGRAATKPPTAGAAPKGWAIAGYDASDHCYVCFDLVAA